MNVDQISLYGKKHNFAEGNVVKAKFKIDKNGYSCDVDLNQYDDSADDDLMRFNQEIEKLKTINEVV
jgi:hypothetical protein